jgi:hypothetical protein
MTAKLNGRLMQLEEIAEQRRARMGDAVLQAAFAALSDADLEAVKPFFERLGRGSTTDEAFASCTPEERAAIEQLGVEWKAAGGAG